MGHDGLTPCDPNRILPSVPWAAFWIERARRVAARRNRAYGLEVSPALASVLAAGPAQLGVLASLRVIAYVLLGSPWQVLRLFWLHLSDRDTPRRRRRVEALAGELRPVLSPGARLGTQAFERRLLGRNLARVPPLVQGLLHRTIPLLTVQPGTEADVAALVRFAAARRLSVYPRGISSSAFGGAVPTRNGLVLDFSSMAEILALDRAARSVRVQPGVRWADLCARLEPEGLAPLTTPTSRFSTVAGWAATGGLGLEGFRYGHFAQALLGARVVVPDGRILALTAEDPLLRDLIGTEGQLGIVTELTLRLRERPSHGSPHLVYCGDLSAALALVGRVIDAGCRPSHLAVFDETRMAEENRLFRDRTGLLRDIVEEQAAVLLHFDDAGLEATCLQELGGGPGGDGRPEPARILAARYLWSERFFPLKAQRLGPTLLASELTLPLHAVERYATAARRLGRRFGSELTLELSLASTDRGTECVVISAFPCDASRRLDYLLRLALTQLLTRLGVQLGGRPYGIGIWNAPLWRARYSPAERARLAQRKRELDPQRLLNPMKFFHLRTRFWNLPGLLFLRGVYGAAMLAAWAVSPVLGTLARVLGRPHPRADVRGWLVPAVEEERGLKLLRETAARCTFCGACVSTCPAYLLTRDERVSGRAKLGLFEELARRGEVLAGEAHQVFQCFACGLCEEVCQVRLPLRACYTALEGRIEAAFGRPADLIRSFAARADAERARFARTFGLELPAWSPPPFSSPSSAPEPGP